MPEASTEQRALSVNSLVDRLRHRDRLALARLLTLVARGEAIGQIRSAVAPAEDEAATSPSQGRIVAFTGSGGVGKSSLIGKLIDLIRLKNQSVAVLACDPQSPLTGGALLGDRLRMPSRPDDTGVFVRSLATAAGHGAVAEHLDLMIDVLKEFGFDWVLLETVGAGQGDTAVRNLADLVVLLLQPEAGDDIQWEKAGLLEVADIVVIHKADLPGAERVEAQVRSILNLPGAREVPIVRVSAARSTGLAELFVLLAKEPLPHRPITAQDSLLNLAMEELRRRYHELPAGLAEVQARWAQGKLSNAEATQQVLSLLAGAAVIRTAS